MRDFIEIEWKQSGQPRAYADSIYSAYVTMRRDEVLLNGIKFYITLSERKVKELAQILIHPYEESPIGCQPYLAKCMIAENTDAMREIANNPNWLPKEGCRWLVQVIAPYTD